MYSKARQDCSAGHALHSTNMQRTWACQALLSVRCQAGKKAVARFFAGAKHVADSLKARDYFACIPTLELHASTLSVLCFKRRRISSGTHTSETHLKPRQVAGQLPHPGGCEARHISSAKLRLRTTLTLFVTTTLNT